MDWARMLAYITGTVDQELLLCNEYLVAENRILKAQIKGRLLLSDAERVTLAEIGHRLGRKALEEVAATAKPDIILGAGEFFGKGCLAGQPLRIATATAIADCTLARIEKSLMVRMLHEQHDASIMFVMDLLSRSIRYEADLVGQFFDSNEKRLARTLLLLARFDKECRANNGVSRVNQDNLAQMIGTTRSRIRHFMNKFRKLGFIDYSDNGWLTVHNGLFSVVLYDKYRYTNQRSFPLVQPSSFPPP